MAVKQTSSINTRNKYVALLRGINLGNKNKILMKDLRELFMHLGFLHIKTYIQTGNVVFSSNDDENAHDLSIKIEDQIFSSYGFKVPIIVKTEQNFKDILIQNPFIQKGITDNERLHLTLLAHAPQQKQLEEIKAFATISHPDEFSIIGKNVFIYCSKRYMDTKLGNNFFEKKLKINASTRNWKTILKINELLNNSD